MLAKVADAAIMCYVCVILFLNSSVRPILINLICNPSPFHIQMQYSYHISFVFAPGRFHKDEEYGIFPQQQSDRFNVLLTSATRSETGLDGVTAQKPQTSACVTPHTAPPRLCHVLLCDQMPNISFFLFFFRQAHTVRRAVVAL